jgi:signal peptidase I
MSFKKFKKNLKYIDPFHPYDLLITYLKKKMGYENKFLGIVIFIIYSLILAFLLLKILALILGAHQAMMIVVSGSMEPKLQIGDIVVLFSTKNISTNYIDINANLKDVKIHKYIIPRYSILGDYNINDLSLQQVLYFKSLNPELEIYLQDLNINNVIVNPDFSGDIVVYYSELYKKEIIHRAILGINALDGTYYLTKGDNLKTNFRMDEYCPDFSNYCFYPYFLPKENLLSKYLFKIPFLGWIKLAPAKLFGF